MAIQLLPGEHAEILTELEVGLGEVLEHKSSNISETRRDKVTMESL